MKKRFKWLGVALACIAVIGLAGCGKSSSSGKTVKVGIVGSDKGGVWKTVAADVKKDGINLKVVEFSDYDQPNIALRDGDLDINATQQRSFLAAWDKEHKTTLTPIGNTVIAPLAVYSDKLKSLKGLKKGATIAIPNDSTDETRSLQLLSEAGLIKVDPSKDLPTLTDITENKLKLKLKELAPNLIPKALPDVDLAIINSGIASDAKLKPTDALYRAKVTKASKPWINCIAARKKDVHNKTYQKIVKAYQTEKIAKLIKKVNQGSVIPAWNIKL
ncbi:MetQ/NlpA family ABC transporter substrate-binding protein [Lacticaseibacillus nasuensis]|nr:MetQ/NlpA family ABC transporter substrate-binding protein [Lacticaseibacillus nasuensis]MCX2455856.1 MetQ/NlpA family ABC transporter substrate-binding protein [Lacticaseibacillus nasuensis]